MSKDVYFAVWPSRERGGGLGVCGLRGEEYGTRWGWKVVIYLGDLLAEAEPTISGVCGRRSGSEKTRCAGEGEVTSNSVSHYFVQGVEVCGVYVDT